MPLDLVIDNVNDNKLFELPNELNFDVSHEKTRFHEKKYVINENTDEVIGIVGNSFNGVSHKDFYEGVQDTILNNRSSEELRDAKVKFRTAKNNAWSMVDIVLPNVKALIQTPKREIEIAERLIALHGVDGSCSNQVYFGAIDFFCTNGQISGEFDKVRRKNTSRFNIDTFIDELNNAKQTFYTQSDRLQTWANTSLSHQHSNIDEIIKKIVVSERKAEKMTSLYFNEVSNRGENLFSLYSAFTNYSTYADERNGFNLKNMGNDTNSQSMWNREQEVSKWISSIEFKQLELVA